MSSFSCEFKFKGIDFDAVVFCHDESIKFEDILLIGEELVEHIEKEC